MSPLLRLDPDAPTPLYQQLRKALEEAIAADRFPQGRLPSSRALATELGISRNTVVLAYQELVVDGYVSARPRSGLVVNAEIQERLRRADTAEDEAAAPPAWDELLVAGPDDPFAQLGTPADWTRYPYPFLSAQVDPDRFPHRAWGQAMRDALKGEHAVASLQDSRGRDDALLVEQLCAQVLPARGIRATPEQVLITNGSQHGFYLVSKTLVRPGVRIAVENPGWADVRTIFTAAGGEIVPAGVDHGGIVISTALRHVRLIVVTPSHQFPTRATLSIGRRQELLRICAASNGLLIEDDYDAELRYQGRPTPALKAIDTDGRVVYLGSFSKFLAPGLRLGFIVAAPELIEQMRRWRRIMLRHPAGLLQRALGLFIESGEYNRHLRGHRAVMKRRWERMVAGAERHLPWPLEAPTGGLGLWIEAPEGFDSRVLRERARAEGVLLEPGEQLFQGEQRVNTFTLGFAAIPEERIDAGLQIIGRLARELA